MEVDKYPAPTWKRRLLVLVLVLAVGTAMFIVHMLNPAHARAQRTGAAHSRQVAL